MKVHNFVGGDIVERKPSLGERQSEKPKSVKDVEKLDGDKQGLVLNGKADPRPPALRGIETDVVAKAVKSGDIGDQIADRKGDEPGEEIAMIASSDTAENPGAMVVEASHAAIASATMLGSRGAAMEASGAEITSV